jgi:hypothetical protein
MTVLDMLLAHAPAVALPLDADVLTDPFGWLLDGLLRAIFGTDDLDVVRRALDGWMARLLDPAAAGNPFRMEVMCGPCGSLYDALRPLGLFALALAVLARIGSHALRSRHHGPAPIHMLSDAGIRVLCGVAALQATFPILDWLSAQSVVLAAELSEVVFGGLLRHTGASSFTGLMLSAVHGQDGAAGAATVLLLTLFLAYLGVMVVASRAALIFCVLGAPFSVPAIAYAEDGHLVLLWLRMLVFALALPAVAVLCLAMTVVVAGAGFQLTDVLGVPLIAMGAAIWLSVRVINGLMRETVRGVRGGVSGTLHAAGMAPVAHGAAALARDARRDLGRGVSRLRGPARMAAGAAGTGERRGWAGLRESATPPPPGGNDIFDTFVTRRLLLAGRSKVGGADLPPERREAERRRLWGHFLAQETGFVGRRERAA